MAFHTFGPGLALDEVTGRGIPAVVAQLTDAETGDPVQAYTMDEPPVETTVSTNRYGYFGYFQTADTVRRLRLTFGGVTLEHTAWELLTEAAQNAAEALQAALDALQAAQDAADLVGAPADNVVATLLQNAASLTAIAGDARYLKRGKDIVAPQDFGAVGDGTTDDSAAWASFQAAPGLKTIPAGRYLVGGAVKRFDNQIIGNGEFDDESASWDQPMGDRERNAILVHRNDIDANTQLISPIIKTQTHVNFTRDTPAGSFKHVVGAYHEATYDGYYNTQADTNQNFTVLGSTVFNRMGGLFGALAHLAYVKDANEEEQPLITTMGATKNGCSFLQFTRRSKYENGGYMFGLEVYAMNQANETLDVPYQNNDEFGFTAWTSGIKIGANASGAPISSALFTHGLGAKHGFWNGIVIGGSGFRINDDNQGVPGTIGLSLASHRASAGYADIGIKFRTNNRHLYFREGAKVRASLMRLMYEAGNVGLSLEAGSGSNPYIHFKGGVTDAPDGGSGMAMRGQIDSNNSWTRIQSQYGEVHLSANAGAAIYVGNSARFAPGTATDGTQHLGGADRRWNTIYALNGVIETSDERAKTDIDSIPDAALDAWGRVNFQQYRLRDAIDAKGFGRLHTGVIAQRVVEAFEAEGLDAADYGLLCFDEWEASEEVVHEYESEVKPAVYEKVLLKEAVYEDRVQEDGTIETVERTPAEYGDGELLEPAVTETHRTVTPAVEAGSLYGIRYEEALCFEAAYQRRRSDQLEARLARLESMI